MVASNLFTLIDLLTGETVKTAEVIQGSHEPWIIEQAVGCRNIKASSEINDSSKFLIRAVDADPDLSKSWFVDLNKQDAPSVTIELAYPADITSIGVSGNVWSNYNNAKSIRLLYSDDGDSVTPTWIECLSEIDLSITESETLFTFTSVGDHKWWKFEITSYLEGPDTGVYKKLLSISILRLFDVRGVNQLSVPAYVLRAPGLSGADTDYYAIGLADMGGDGIVYLVISNVTSFDNTLHPILSPFFNYLGAFEVFNGPSTYYVRATGQGVSVFIRVNDIIRGGYIGRFFPNVTPLEWPAPKMMALSLILTPVGVTPSDEINFNPLSGTNNQLIVEKPDGSVTPLKSVGVWPFDSILTAEVRQPLGVNPIISASMTAQHGIEFISATRLTRFYENEQSFSEMGFAPGMNIFISGSDQTANNRYHTITAMGSIDSENEYIDVDGTFAESYPSDPIFISAEDYYLLPCILYSKETNEIFGYYDGIKQVCGGGRLRHGDTISENGHQYIVLALDSERHSIIALLLE